MDVHEKYDYWLEHAKYDMDTAKTMLDGGRWLYVPFMCQQAVEKLVKGLYGLHIGFDRIPHIHNITRLVEDLKDLLPQSVQSERFDLFDLLTRYYLNNRYPNYRMNLNAQTTEAAATNIYTRTKEAFTWLQTLKP